jgi:hypothetical protein
LPRDRPTAATAIWSTTVPVVTSAHTFHVHPTIATL